MSDNTLRLHKAITRDGKPLTDISLREPSAGELRGIKLFDLVQGDTGALVELLPRISTPALTKQEALGLGLRDTMLALNLVATMITGGEGADGNDDAGKPSP